ncbi:MAG: hypothetical protein KAS17_02660 [Victivallaceae bacterium]|nr:hypothetical protein [Victivallaceae bacterium]
MRDIIKTNLIFILLFPFFFSSLGANHISPSKMDILHKIDKRNSSFKGVSMVSLMPDYPYKSEISKVENIQKLKFGVSQDEVENIFGKNFRYQFKILKNNAKYECISWFFIKRRSRYFFIFKNGKLVSIVEPPIGKLRIVKKYYAGKMRNFQERVFSNPIERVNSTLNIKSLSLNEFQLMINKRIPKKLKPINPFISLTFSIFVSNAFSQMKKDYKTNFQLLKKYCLDKVLLGNSLNDVKMIMGTPCSMRETEKRKIFIYGENKNLKINHMIKFSWLAIVLKNDKVSCAFSNYYFPKEWKPQSKKR